MGIKIKKEDFLKRFYDKNGNDYDILDFSGMRSSVTIKHSCGNIYVSKRAEYLSPCPICTGIRKTTDSFKSEVKKLVGDEYEVLGEYVNNSSKIRMCHNKCKCEFEIRPVDFIRGQRCGRCFAPKKRTEYEFKSEVKKLVGDEYEVLDGYINYSTKTRFLHKRCGNEFEMPPTTFLLRSKCPHCYGTHMKTTDVFRSELFDIVGDEYKLVGEYKGTNHKNKFIHNSPTCKGNGKTFEMKPNSFLSSGARCPFCFGSKRKTTNEFKSEVKKLVGDEYEVLGEYVNNKTKIKIKHINCKNEFLMTPNHFLTSGNRCPICNHSKNEKEICKYLDSISISYLFDKAIPEHSKRERFDFQILDKSKKIIAIIEYDGEFHYHPIFGEDRLKKQKASDKRKNDYCKKKNIPLLRIPFWKNKNKEKIIEKFLEKYSQIKIAPSTTIREE